MKKKFQVFVSSTYEDLKEERKAVLESLLKSHFIPAGMEYFNASNKQSWDIITKDIDESDYYVLIVAGKYGSLVRGETPEISYTEKEYNYACSIGNGTIIIKYYDAMPLDFYWRIDDVLYTGPYWFGTASQQTVTYKFSKGGRGFSLYSNYFEDLWNNSTLTRIP